MSVRSGKRQIEHELPLHFPEPGAAIEVAGAQTNDVGAHAQPRAVMLVGPLGGFPDERASDAEAAMFFVHDETKQVRLEAVIERPVGVHVRPPYQLPLELGADQPMVWPAANRLEPFLRVFKGGRIAQLHAEICHSAGILGLNLS